MRVQKIRGVRMRVQKFSEECMRVLFIKTLGVRVRVSLSLVCL